jgi:hypothetical protein
MARRRTLYLFIGAVANSALFFIIPDYYFWFLAVMSVGAIICITIIVADILGKTKLWKGAIVWLAFGALSWLLGILAIIIRNYFLGYYSN